jgi:hypothetical protein
MKFERTSPEYLATLADDDDDEAFLAHLRAETKARAEWDAIPDSEAKDSARINADDMAFTEGLIMPKDVLGWLRAAIDTYNLNG